MNSKFIVVIDYAGLRIDVFMNGQDKPVTPLAGLAGTLGLDGPSELARVQDSEWLPEGLGLQVIDGQACILAKQVFRWLMSLEPEAMVSAGNTAGADLWLKAVDRCADALHEYEQTGSAVNFAHPSVKAAMNETAGQLQRQFGLPRHDAA